MHVQGQGQAGGTSGPLPQSGLYAPMLGRDQVVGVVQVQSAIDQPFHRGRCRGDLAGGQHGRGGYRECPPAGGPAAQQPGADPGLRRHPGGLVAGAGPARRVRPRATPSAWPRPAVELAQTMGIERGGPGEFPARGAAARYRQDGHPGQHPAQTGPADAGGVEIMRRHPQYAYELLQPIEYLRPALDIPYCHHEKWDGTGYPRRLKGEEIPLAARIFAVIDVWDALTSDRPYRLAWSQGDALAYIRSQSGQHFDPAIVDAFFSMMGKA